MTSSFSNPPTLPISHSNQFLLEMLFSCHLPSAISSPRYFKLLLPSPRDLACVAWETFPFHFPDGEIEQMSEQMSERTSAPGVRRKWGRKHSLAVSFPSRVFGNKRLLRRIRGSGITVRNCEQKCLCERNGSISYQFFCHKYSFFVSANSNKIPRACEEVLSTCFQEAEFLFGRVYW